MAYQNISFQDHRGYIIHAYLMVPDINLKGIVYISHGMKEHGKRYHAFSQFLAEHGYISMVHDHRGHGKTAINLGYLGENATWNNLIQNVQDGIEYLRLKFPGLPVFLLGHSMGSFVALGYAREFKGLSGLLLSGSSFQSPFLTGLGYLISLFNCFIFGKKNKAYFIESLIFLPFILSIKNRKTKADWISRDPMIVERYLQDPYCQFTCTSSFYIQFFSGLIQLFFHKKPLFKHLLPIFIFSGDQDPVGGRLKQVKRLIQFLSKEQHPIETKFYTGARHEVLNEINKKEVYADVLVWLQSKTYPS